MNNLFLEQLMWRYIGPTKKKKKIAYSNWVEIDREKAIMLLSELENLYFKEIIYHFESNIIDIFLREHGTHFNTNNSRFNIKSMIRNDKLIHKTLILKDNNYLEVRFIFSGERVDICLKQ